MSLPPGVSDVGLPHVTGFFNLIAVLIVLVITSILVIGIKESANFTSTIVIVKVGIVGIFLVVGAPFSSATRRSQVPTGIPLCHRRTGTVTSVGVAFRWLRLRFSLLTSALTRSLRRRRKRRIRSAICRSASANPASAILGFDVLARIASKTIRATTKFRPLSLSIPAIVR